MPDAPAQPDATPERKLVMAVGVFDLVHLGHVHYLTEARKLGDSLVVVVATDKSMRARKHAPIMGQDLRRALVAALKPVDRAIVGHEEDHYLTVEEVRPDVIALGYDDYHRAEEIKTELTRRGLGHIEVARMPKFDDHDLNGTRKIVSRIIARYEADARAGEGATPLRSTSADPEEAS